MFSWKNGNQMHVDSSEIPSRESLSRRSLGEVGVGYQKQNIIRFPVKL